MSSGNLTRISELHNYKVEPGDPDPRGWTVVTPDGREIGVVDDLLVDTTAMKVRYLVVNGTAGDDALMLDASDVDVRDQSRQIVARGDGAIGRGSAAAAASSDRSTRDQEYARLTRSEEELRVGTREVERGEAVIGKHVVTERVSQPVTRRREEVVVERRPVEAGARADATIDNDEIRIPLTEEEVIVEKRPVVKEELVVGKRVVEERDTVSAEVRREEFDVDTNPKPGNAGRFRNER
jgi:uncharacterized protein (TIGR02271 family)